MPQQARTHPNGGLLLLFLVASILGNGENLNYTPCKDTPYPKPPTASAILRRMNRWRVRQLPRATFGHYT